MNTATAILALFVACPHLAWAQWGCPTYNVKKYTKTADNAGGLKTIADQYKEMLGGESNGNLPGPIEGGQRSVNWDAGALPFDMPPDFFNVVATRGIVFNTTGNEFRVSNPGDSTDVDDGFNTLIPYEVAKQFKRFSQKRLFTPLQKNSVTAEFRTPAADTKATVAGFAAVFTDVDLAGKTYMNYYDKERCLIASVEVPPKDSGLSFAGIIVLSGDGVEQSSTIASVDVNLGSMSITDFKNPAKWSGDVVVMDDLFYSEPIPIA